MKTLSTIIILLVSFLSYGQTKKAPVSGVDSSYSWSIKLLLRDSASIMHIVTHTDVKVETQSQSVSVTVFWKQNFIRVIKKEGDRSDTTWLNREDNSGNSSIPANVDTSVRSTRFIGTLNRRGVIAEFIRNRIQIDCRDRFREKINGYYYQ